MMLVQGLTAVAAVAAGTADSSVKTVGDEGGAGEGG